MGRANPMLIAGLIAVLPSCQAMQGTISTDEIYTSREGVFQMSTPRPYNVKSPKYFVRDHSSSDGQVAVDFFPPYAQSDGTHFAAGYMPAPVIHSLWPDANRQLRPPGSGLGGEPDLFLAALDLHAVRIQCIFRQAPRTLLRDVPLSIGGKAVHYSVLTLNSNMFPGRRTAVPTYFYFGVYLWEAGDGMMWLMVNSDPGFISVEEVPTVESLRLPAMLEVERKLVASVVWLKSPPGGAASSKIGCS